MGEKEKKYDRQLRLWGDHGQRALESASVCMVNVTATSTETLKNLILPGIGRFVIVDGGHISGENAGSNFFLDPDLIGETRAKVATRMLLELNPDVKGEYVEESTEQLLATNPQFFKSFTVVVACCLKEETLKILADLLWENNIPLLTCVSYGFIGYLRLVVQEHCVVESHPDNVHEDLRLDFPLEEMVSYSDSIDLDSLSNKDHSHTPYLIILHKFLKMWKTEHNGEAPISYKEKREFKNWILTKVRAKENGNAGSEENFDEAAKNVNSALVKSSIPSHVQEILNDNKCSTITEESNNFWLLAFALKKFVENEPNNLLPLRGSLPDMVSDSERYVQLQRIYRSQANADILEVTKYVAQTCRELGCGNGKMSERDIKRFCRNAHFLRVVRTRSLEDEYRLPSKQVIDCFTQSETTDVMWYVMMRCVEDFRTLHARYPGTRDEEIESDLSRLKGCLKNLTKSWGLPGATEAISDDYLQEICRCGASEIHSVAAYMGGVTAQEIIKIITKQYVPINSAYIYNGLKSTSSTINI